MSTLSMPWGSLWYGDAGDSGVPLVFLHGSGCDSSDWDSVIGALPPTWRTIRMDFRGHGRSDVTDQPFTVKDLSDDIAALLGALKIEEAILVGHSLGGMLAMDVAARTTLACALVLLEGWTRLGAGAALEGKRFFGTLSEATIESIQAKGKAMRGRFKPGIWEAFWQTLQAFDGLPFLESASIPVIEAYGEMGRTERTFERLLIPPNPHIKVRWIPSAGHYLPIEEPVEIAALCREAADLVGDRTRRSEG